MLQRARGDRPDGRDDETAGADPADDRRQNAGVPSRVEPGRRGRCRGEDDDVDLADRRLLHAAGHRVGVRWWAPPVDDEGSHRGAGGGEVDVELFAPGSVVLDRDPLSGNAFGDEEVADLGRGLRLGDPVGVVPGGLDRTPGLGPAGDDPGGVCLLYTSDAADDTR